LDEKIFSKFDLNGRVIVITGGAGLLGITYAEAIAGVGGIPVLADLNEESVHEKADILSKNFDVRALGIKVDITCKADIQDLRDKILEEFGRIDGLINNAANNPKVEEDKKNIEWSRFENFSIETWDKDLAVGLKGAFLCSQILGETMARQGKGVIINISSDLGLVAPDQRLYKQERLPDSRQPVKPVTYSVIKTGLIGLTRYLATYWADFGVRVNTLCPGGVEAGQPEEFKDRLHSRIPLGRMAEKDEYQGAILFLLSDASSYMTGATLPVDGGRTCW